MIPHRVQLSGFLSYKDAQEITFAGSPLWMLTGTNGSGKSSIFDAVTYSLFGHHRGGSQNADELINKESNALFRSGLTSLGGVGGVCSTACISAPIESPTNGLRPVNNS